MATTKIKEKPRYTFNFTEDGLLNYDPDVVEDAHKLKRFLQVDCMKYMEEKHPQIAADTSGIEGKIDFINMKYSFKIQQKVAFKRKFGSPLLQILDVKTSDDILKIFKEFIEGIDRTYYVR